MNQEQDIDQLNKNEISRNEANKWKYIKEMVVQVVEWVGIVIIICWCMGGCLHDL